MATPKKKRLIELMIEADVKWPDGAKYAAQDKDTMRVRFYRIGKPFHDFGVDYWNSFCGSLINGVMVKLPELCSNWHQTIVTREQYVEARAAIGDKASQSKESEDIDPYAIPENAESLSINLVPQSGFYKPNGTSETAVDQVEWHNPQSIEQLTSDYRAKAAEADRLQAVADEALKAADDALLALEKAGELLGLVISIDTNPKLPVQPEMTDWRDLRVGDVVEHIEDNGGNLRIGSIGKINEVCEEYIKVDYENWTRYGYGVPDDIHKFKFIRRS